MRTLSPRCWLVAAGCAALVSILIPFQRFDVNFSWTLQRFFGDLPFYFACAFFFLMAFAWADAIAPADRIPPLWHYAIGVIGASAMSVALAIGLADWRSIHLAGARPVVEGRVVEGPPLTRDSRRFIVVQSLGLTAVLHGTLAVFMFVGVRNARLSAQAFAAAELARAEASRRLMVSRAVAAEAVLDPESVLATLREVELVYDVDPEGASARLDQLITRLRDSIPRVHAAEDGINAA